MNEQNKNSTTPAGWYPVEPGTLRYWDGQIWTEHTAPEPTPEPVPVEKKAPKEGVIRRILRKQNESIDKKNFGARLTVEKKQRECAHQFTLRSVGKRGSKVRSGMGAVAGGLTYGTVGAVVGALAFGQGRSDGKAWVCRKCGAWKE